MTAKVIPLSTVAAADLVRILPDLPILGTELNRLITALKPVLQAASASQTKTQIVIEVYPVTQET